MKVVFISGSRSIIKLNDDVIKILSNMIQNKFIINIGDSFGVDALVQRYLYSENYRLVNVFSSGMNCRCHVDRSWVVTYIPACSNLKGAEFYAVKDKFMASKADFGFVIWDEKSKGSLNNIKELLKNGKRSLVYLTNKEKFVSICNENQLMEII